MNMLRLTNRGKLGMPTVRWLVHPIILTQLVQSRVLDLQSRSKRIIGELKAHSDCRGAWRPTRQKMALGNEGFQLSRPLHRLDPGQQDPHLDRRDVYHGRTAGPSWTAAREVTSAPFDVKVVLEASTPVLRPCKVSTALFSGRLNGYSVTGNRVPKTVNPRRHFEFFVIRYFALACAFAPGARIAKTIPTSSQ